MKGKFKNHELQDFGKDIDIEELDADDPRVMQVLQESQMDIYEVPYCFIKYITLLLKIIYFAQRHFLFEKIQLIVVKSANCFANLAVSSRGLLIIYIYYK